MSDVDRNIRRAQREMRRGVHPAIVRRSYVTQQASDAREVRRAFVGVGEAIKAGAGVFASLDGLIVKIITGRMIGVTAEVAELKSSVAELRARVATLEHARTQEVAPMTQKPEQETAMDNIPSDSIPAEFVVRNSIEVAPERWGAFINFINEPAEPTEALRRLFSDES